MIITNAQKEQIEVLLEARPDMVGPLIAYGADMHRQGIIKGAIIFAVGAITAHIVGIVKENVDVKVIRIKKERES